MKAINVDHIVERLKSEAPPNQPWVFDCDGTIINGDIASMTAWGLLRSGMADPNHLPAKWKRFMETPSEFERFLELRDDIVAERGVTGVFEWEMLLHSGMPPSMVLKAAREALQESKKRGLVIYTHPVSRFVKFAGERAWIVSGSPNICVFAIVEELGIPMERIIASELEQVDGIYMPRLIPPGVVWEGIKRQKLEEAKIHPWIVFGDTIGDWQMMQLASDWVWCIVWDEHRFRGHEFREHLQANLLGDVLLPKEPGHYLHEIQGRNWIFEVKFPGNI